MVFSFHSSCTYEGWLEHSKQVKSIAEAEMESSCRMRESLFVAREKVRNDLRTQQERTEHILRKRIFDTQRARNEFEWQIIKVNKFFFLKLCIAIKIKNSQHFFLSI